jgi:hypothetical protein
MMIKSLIIFLSAFNLLKAGEGVVLNYSSYLSDKNVIMFKCNRLFVYCHDGNLFQ